MNGESEEDAIFNKLLEEYKSNYVEYMSTGTDDFKKAYENSLNAIHKIILTKQAAVDRERANMKHFAGSYKKDGDSLGKLQDKAGKMYNNAQKIQDKYETSKKRYDNWLKNEPSQAIDYTNGYGILWRIGLAGLLLLFIFAISFYNPNATSRPWFSGTGTTISIPSFGSSVPGSPAFGSPAFGSPRIPMTPGSPGAGAGQGLSITMSPAWGRR